MKKYILLSLILIATLTTNLIGQPKTLHFKHYTVDNGLPSNIVRSIIQDNRGYMWFGTEKGLCSFDGSHFKIYQHQKNSPNQLGNDYINTICEDLKNEIWLGTDDGIYIYNSDSDSFRHFSAQTANGINIDCAVNNIIKDANHNIWFSTYGQGVFRYNIDTHILENYEFSEVSRLINTIYVDSQNTIWIVTRHNERQLYKYNPINNTFNEFKLKYPENITPSSIHYLFEDSARRFWLGTWEHGVLLLNIHNGFVKQIIPAGNTNHIHSMEEYAPNILMIGSDDGLCLYNSLDNCFQIVTPDETDIQSISSKFIYPIVKDNEGGIWIATYYGGVNYISPNSEQFESFTHSQFKNSVNGKIISRFCEDNDGNIWIGSDDGGLSKYNPQTHQFQHVKTQSSFTGTCDNIHALFIDDENLWIGTYTNGLKVINTKNGKIKEYFPIENDPQSLDGSSIYAIFKDKSQNIWVTSMSGVNRYNQNTDNFSRIKDFGFLTIDIEQDKKGDIWFATQGKGLFRYHEATDSWRNYTATEENGTLLCNQINDLLVDSEETLWIATGEGLCKYDDTHDSFIAVPLNTPSSNITGLIEDNYSLWISTSKGLVHYNQDGKIEVYTKSDGLQSDQFLPASILKASDGKIYIGSVNGFNAFYPNNIKTNTHIPPISIVGLEVMNRDVPIGIQSPYITTVNGKKIINLSYKENVFSIKFASLSYVTPSKNQYSYYLEGFDSKWINVGDQNWATYTNLPAGTYTFHVRGSNSDNIWNEKGTDIILVIHPPFYLTLPFKIIYILISILLLIYFSYFIIKQTEKKHQENIRQLNLQKEKEIHDAKIQFFTMIAHEIRTPVSLIIGPMEKIIKTISSFPQEIQDDINMINRNSQRLLSLVNQLLDFRKTENGLVRLNRKNQNIYQLLNTIYIRFAPSAKQKNINFSFECSNQNICSFIDSEAITKVVSNLLTNAIKFTKDTISLKCTGNDDCISISVSDNGCGIAPNDQSQIFKPFFQTEEGEKKMGTGIGLNIAKTLTVAHNGSINVISTPNEGATFIVTIPIISIQKTDEPSTDIHSNNTILPPQFPEKTNKTLLLVEDNDDMLHFLQSNFKSKFHILTALNGIEALNILQSKEVHIVISDWMMPKMDGIELCKNIRSNQLTSHIPFILLTAKTDNKSKTSGMENGADIYLEKPFSIEYLNACVNNILEIRHLLHEKFSTMPLVPLNSIAVNNTDKDFLSNLNHLIEDNFSNAEFSIDDLAQKMNVSRSGLFSKIKVLTDVTPNELIQIVRMKKAAQLILENKYRINEICYMVGFNSPSYFSKCFQKQFGIKPIDFFQEKQNTSKATSTF